MLNVLLYGSLKWFLAPQMPFLNRMAVCFGVVVAVLAVVSLAEPMAAPVVMSTTNLIALESSRGAKIWGAVVVLCTTVLYLVFW